MTLYSGMADEICEKWAMRRCCMQCAVSSTSAVRIWISNPFPCFWKDADPGSSLEAGTSTEKREADLSVPPHVMQYPRRFVRAKSDWHSEKATTPW